MQNSNFEPSIILKTYQLYRDTYKRLENFPKRSRYTLGEKIENNLLDLIELISLANIQIKPLREPILHRASAKCETIKLLVRLSCDLSILNERHYVELESRIREIGKMLGGWIKFSRAQ